MMKPTHIAFALLLGAALIGPAVTGCAKKDEGKAPPVAEAPPSGNEPKPVSGSEQSPKGLPISSVPADLKHEAFDYYGLENLAPMEFEVVSTALTTVESGTATTTLSAVEGGVAKFITARTGTLSQMGDEEVEVRKDGVYNTKIGGHPIEPAQLVLPVDLAVGKTWTTSGKVTAQTPQGLKTFDQKFSYRVVGPEKVKTKAGEFDSLKVLANGTITLDGKKNQSEVVAWYVKRMGTVKMEIKSTGAQKVTMSIQATKVPG